MTAELKSKIISTMQLINGWVGKNISIQDYICTSGRTYDRHQTRHGRCKLRIKKFHIRTSGSIATIYSEEQQVEFRSDSIKKIKVDKTTIEMEINMKGSIWRKLIINKEEPADNNR